MQLPCRNLHDIRLRGIRGVPLQPGTVWAPVCFAQCCWRRAPRFPPPVIGRLGQTVSSDARGLRQAETARPLAGSPTAGPLTSPRLTSAPAKTPPPARARLLRCVKAPRLCPPPPGEGHRCLERRAQNAAVLVSITAYSGFRDPERGNPRVDCFSSRPFPVSRWRPQAQPRPASGFRDGGSGYTCRDGVKLQGGQPPAASAAQAGWAPPAPVSAPEVGKATRVSLARPPQAAGSHGVGPSGL